MIRWCTAVLLLCSVLAPASAQNLLPNPHFAVPAAGVPPGMTVTLDGLTDAIGHGSASAAAGWLMWDNSPTFCSTTLVSLPERPGRVLPLGGATGIGVAAGGDWNGLYAPFAGAPRVMLAAEVYVVSGRLGLGAGDYGLTRPTIQAAGHGAWEILVGPNTVTPANEVVFYALGGPAVFYVREAVCVPLTLGGLEGFIGQVTDDAPDAARLDADVEGYLGAAGAARTGWLKELAQDLRRLHHELGALDETAIVATLLGI